MSKSEPDSLLEYIKQNEELKKELSDLKSVVKSTEALRATSDKLRKEQEEMYNNSIKNIESTKASVDSAKAQKDAITETVEKERAEIEAEREAIKSEREALEAEKVAFESAKNEQELVQAKITEQKEELEARNIELSEKSGQRNTQIREAKEAVASMKTESAQLEAMRNEATAKSEESRLLLEKIEQSNADAEITMKNLIKARDEAEDRRLAAQSEISSASYASDMSKHLTMVFRQELARYIQIGGQEIKIPELTDEHRKFIASQLLSECVEATEGATEGANSKEVGSREELRMQYEARFGVKPFNGWNAETLLSKINA